MRHDVMFHCFAMYKLYSDFVDMAVMHMTVMLTMHGWLHLNNNNMDGELV
jgi:hypothetical protein